VVVHGKWFEVLLLLDRDDHLLEIARCDVPLATATSAVHRVLSYDLGTGDIEGCGGGGGRVVGIKLEYFFVD
jgi:hypothetical protein